LIERGFDLHLACAALKHADHRLLELPGILGDFVVAENTGSARQRMGKRLNVRQNGRGVTIFLKRPAAGCQCLRVTLQAM